MGQAKQRGPREQRVAEAKAQRAESPVVRELTDARSRYANQWEVSSRHFFDAGYYDWMADKVSDRKAVLEIGCGVGFSTLTLAQRGHSIVAIDENPRCLMATKERLEANGYSVDLHLRGVVEGSSEQTYEVQYGDFRPDAETHIRLIEGDLLNDSKLTRKLPETYQFDAVVCWLLGTHQFRAAERRFENYGAGDQFGFRILVQNATYALADTVLRPYGKLHVVDRGGFVNDERIIEAIKESHREQASVTSLVVEDVDHKEYGEADAHNAMPMGWTPPDNPIDGVNLSEQFPALISVTSTKPG